MKDCNGNELKFNDWVYDITESPIRSSSYFKYKGNLNYETSVFTDFKGNIVVKPVSHMQLLRVMHRITEEQKNSDK